METVRALPGVQGSFTVGDRQAGGGRRQADAFRQALQQGGQPEGQATAKAVPVVGQRPVRPALQVESADGRKDQTSRHVDVIA